MVPLILSHQGATILHASAVASPYGALAFVGGTGRGKSTLAASFAGGGHGFMSDDGLILECRDTSWFARPNRPCFRLFADSRAAFLGDAAPFEPGDFDSKSRVEASDHLPFHATPEQICGIYFLGPGDSESTRIERIRPPDALAQLIEHSFILDAEDRKRISAHFSQLAELAEASLCYALDYPRRYERLPSTIAEIIEHADGVRRGR